MAINNIPGVGPANSDIATAVSTAVPTIGEITSAVTSNAASAGVTMTAITNAITSNAASAGVTMAAITSAITTNAASAGVTMAAITNAITNNAASAGVTIAAITSAGNSAGWGTTGGETWTAITSVNIANGTTAINLTGLSGYKKYRLFMGGLDSATNAELRGYINGVTSEYTTAGFSFQSGQANPSILDYYRNGYFSIYPQNSTQVPFIEMIIDQANLTGYKTIAMKLAGNIPVYYETYATTRQITAPLSSIYVYRTSGGWAGGYYTLYGAN